jgi:hypothetical protein
MDYRGICRPSHICLCILSVFWAQLEIRDWWCSFYRDRWIRGILFDGRGASIGNRSRRNIYKKPLLDSKCDSRGYIGMDRMLVYRSSGKLFRIFDWRCDFLRRKWLALIQTFLFFILFLIFQGNNQELGL